MTKISKIYTKTLREINDIPPHTRIRVISLEKHKIVVLNEDTGERVVMHQPTWWKDNINITPILNDLLSISIHI